MITKTYITDVQISVSDVLAEFSEKDCLDVISEMSDMNCDWTYDFKALNCCLRIILKAINVNLGELDSNDVKELDFDLLERMYRILIEAKENDPKRTDN